MVGGTFLININCAKILDSEAAHYIMFIDSSKMSIVYELVEWIRWMFSLEDCFYLTHENSVIHELEDIQMLSKLKNFEIIPCGQPHCVHKRNYRMLLRNFSLFASWNEIKVHKYFLDKINQMNQKHTRESTEENNCTRNTRVHENIIDFNAETERSKRITPEENKLYFHDNQNIEFTSEDVPVIENMSSTNSYYKPTVSGESPSMIKTYFDTKIAKKNFLVQCNDSFAFLKATKNSEDKNLENEKSCISGYNDSSSDKDPTKKESLYQRSTKNLTRPKALNKPFSLGEILSNIRKDFEEKSQKEAKGNISLRNLIEDRNSSETKNVAAENSFLVQDLEKKKHRTRRRKRSKKQKLEDEDITANILENKKLVFSPSALKSECNLKPLHIRFDEDVEDNLMEFECAPIEDELQLNNKEVNNAKISKFLKNEPEKLMSDLNTQCHDVLQTSFIYNVEKNDATEVECLPVSDNKVLGEENLIDVKDKVCNEVNLPCSTQKKIEFNDVNDDLNDLLSLKEKFKNGIVFQRFY